MKRPQRLDVLIALTEHLEGITPENGYKHNLAGKVYRGKNFIGAEVERPALSIIESPQPDVSRFTGEWGDTRRAEWVVLIQGIVNDDKTHPSDPAYYLAAEVEAHLSRLIVTDGRTGLPIYPTEHLLGGRIVEMELAPAVVRPPENSVSASAFFFLPLRLTLAAETSEPFVSL